MNRTRLYLGLIFTLVAFLNLGGVAWAVPVISFPSVTWTETGGNAGANIGEVIHVQCIVVDDAGLAFSPEPWVNLTGVGGLAIQTLTKAGTLYSCDFTLPEGNVNNANLNFLIVARNVNGEFATAFTNSLVIDNAKPLAPGGVTLLVNGVATTGPVLSGNTFGFEITDTRFQSAPADTRASVNLSAIGLAPAVAMNHIGGGVFRCTGLVPPANTDVNQAFVVRLTDPYNQFTDVNTNSITIDTNAPTFAAATVQILSGNTTAHPGDVLRLTVRLNSNDGDSVIASQTTLTACSPLFPQSLTFDGTQWTIDITLGQELVKNPALPIDFIVSDNAGNVRTRRVTVPVDLEPPNFNLPAVNIYSNDRTVLFGGTTASATDFLQFVATIPINIADTIDVTVDLRPIGGAASYPLSLTTINGINHSYQGWFLVPIGTLENVPPFFSFTVNAVDSGGNVVWRLSTPPILVDNRPPTLSNAVLSRVGGGTSVKWGEQITVSCTVTNHDGGQPPWVDLRRIGGLASGSLSDMGGGNWSGTFLVDWPVTGFQPIDGTVPFKITVNDDVNNLTTLDTNTLSIDSEPPVVRIATWSVSPPLDNELHQWIKIGDQLTLKVQLVTPAKGVRDNDVVITDLTSVGAAAAQNMAWDNSATYTYSFKVATGTLNDGATFPVTITDDGGNATTTQIIVIPFDNNPPDPGSLTVTGKEYVESVGAYNIGDRVIFNLPISLETIDDHRDALVDLTALGSATTIATMTYDPAGFYTMTWFATGTTTNLEAQNYVYRGIVYDKARNGVGFSNGYHTVDCWPPVIHQTTVGLAGNGPGGIGNIGRLVQIHVRTSEEDGGVPYIDLSAWGKSSTEFMTASSASHWWDYNLTIATGTTFNGVAASWLITIQDNAGNIATANTPYMTIDNVPPITAGALSVTWNDSQGDNRIRLGDLVTFTLTMGDLPTQIGSATVNLTTIGGPANATMTYVGNSFTLATTTRATSPEVTNYSFPASVIDINSNRLNVAASPVDQVDCLVPVFGPSGIVITTTNNDNPDANVANTNDVLTVYASMSHAVDAFASATIEVGGIGVATAPLIWVAARARYEAVFIVTGSTGAWGSVDRQNLVYRLTAVDDAQNFAVPSSGASTFLVDNTVPTLLQVDWRLSPDVTELNPVYNVGSGTPVDLMWASASLVNSEPVSSAFLNLSSLPGAPANLALTVSGNQARNTTGINLTQYPLTDLVLTTFSITLRDMAGNPITSSQSFQVDTKRPQITQATFDGTTLSVVFQEPIRDLAINQWQLRGSDTQGIATFTTAQAGDTVNSWFDSFEIIFSDTHRKAIAAWASQPLTLRTVNSAAALRDISGNWSTTYTGFPVTITDSSWRESPKITSFSVQRNWPAVPSIVLEFAFNKSVATETLIASNAVLLFQNLGYDFSAVDYVSGYVFQPTDLIEWVTGSSLRITLGEDGAAWVAKKIGNGATPLRFATRNASSIFVRDGFGKPMTAIPTSNALSANVIRPYTGNPLPPFDFMIEGGTLRPILNLAESYLELQTTDRTLLYADDFRTVNTILPAMGMPLPTYNRRVTAFHNQIELHDTDAGTFRTIGFSPLSQTLNPTLSSTTIRLNLSATDLTNIYDIFSRSVSPIWGIKVKAGAFSNWWGQPNLAHLPSGLPGDLEIVPPTTVPPTLAACSISDFPPVKFWAAGGLTFECEIQPSVLGAVQVPISLASPSGRIIRQDTDTPVVDGVFQGWTTRTVNGTRRWVARFISASDFPPDLADVPNAAARIEINDVRDIFGTSMSGTASFVYDLTTKSDGAVNGFMSSSVPLVLDSRTPRVVSILPAGNIGLLPAGTGVFEFTFEEDMKTAVQPAIVLATSGRTITWSFQNWKADGRTAQYTNVQPIESTTPNGTWTFTITNGTDLAGNIMPAQNLTVEVRTQTPSVTHVSVTTYQSTISPDPVLDQPFNPSIAPGLATFRLTYAVPPSRDLPHSVRLYDGAGTLVAQLPVEHDGGTGGMATLTAASFVTPPGPDSGELNIRVRDAAGNETGEVRRLTMDAIAPVLSFFSLSNVGLIRGNTIWYNPAVSGDAGVTLNSSNGTDPLRLTILPLISMSTQTINLASPAPGTYTGTFGAGMTEGEYLISAADAAGNLALGDSSRRIIVDTNPPVINAIYPNIAIGATPARSATFTVVFSEPMHTGVTPTLELATTSPIVALIPMTFTGWADSNNATTAFFVNSLEIGLTLPAGAYTYQVGAAVDPARNPLAPSGPFEVNVQSQGPAAALTVLTTQPNILADVLEDQPFSPLISTLGSATIRLTYAGGPFNTPHYLQVYDQSEALVATIGVSAGNPGYVAFPNLTGFWRAGTFPGNNLGPVTYRFKLIDSLGNPSGDYLGSLIYDSLAPTVSSFTFNDNGRGLISDGVKYYSPVLGAAQLSILTDTTQQMRLVIATGTFPPLVIPMDMDGTRHSLTSGDQLTDGLATFSVVDPAGNPGKGSAASLRIAIDRTAPEVTMTTPGPTLGTVAANGGVFEITFNEAMNPAKVPSVQLASNGTVIPLTPVTGFTNGWISSYTCRLSNPNAIANLPVTTYTWQITGVTDLAGNTLAPSASQIWINSQGPAFATTLRTQQWTISTSTWLYDQPYSPSVGPGFGFLSVGYSAGPYGIPHRVLVINPAGVQVAAVPLNPVGRNGTATVNLAFFGMATPAPITGPAPYSLKIQDEQGNITPASLKIVYDALPPTVNTFTVTGGSNATTTAIYYHPERMGPLGVTLGTNASDSLRLVLTGNDPAMSFPVATMTFAMSRNGFTHARTIDPSEIPSSQFPDGRYRLLSIDAAGNPGIGAASSRDLIIDRAAPWLVDLQTSPVQPLRSMGEGAATLTVTFSDPMNQQGSTTPTLELATDGRTIAFRFSGWINSWQARFVNAEPLGNDLPQGGWNVHVTGFDLANNFCDAVWTNPVQIRTRGPIILGWETMTYQQTTASQPSPLGRLYGRPFSPNVNPKVATLSVYLENPPAPDQPPVRLHFQKDGLSVSSSVLNFVGKLATFSWKVGTGPIPAASTTYTMQLIDALGNPSYETFGWSIDPVAPQVTRQRVTGGIASTNSDLVYLNPAIHGALTTEFLVSGEDSPPLMRLRGVTATDTALMTSVSTGIWSGNFTGFTSSGLILPDGAYTLDIVDPAGNVGVAPLGATAVVNLVLDTKAPVVATFTLIANGAETTRFAPAAGPLEIHITSTEPLNPTGLWQLEVRTDTNVLVKYLPIESVDGVLTATWDGTRISGGTVIEGNYRIYATDQAGNRAAASVTVFAITSSFKVVSATQVSPTTFDLSFSHPIDQNTIGGAVLTISPAGPAVIDQQPTANTTVLRATLAAPFDHGVTYTITIEPDTLRNTDGVLIGTGRNQIALKADTQGPIISSISFTGVTGARDVVVTFNERIAATTAAIAVNYTLTRSGHSVGIVNAVPRGDGTSVLLTAAEDLLDTYLYRLTAIGIEDQLGNPSSADLASTTFKGRDLTAPVLSVAVFSNPAHENDIMVAVKSSETLTEVPTLQITQGSTVLSGTALTPGARALSWMAGVSLDPNSGTAGTVKVSGKDVAGNIGTAQINFTTAVVNASLRASIVSADGRLTLEFPVGSVRDRAMVSILPQPLIAVESSASGTSETAGTASVKTSAVSKAVASAQPAAARRHGYPRSLAQIIGRTGDKRASVVSEAVTIGKPSVQSESTSSELEIVGEGYEVVVAAEKLIKPFALKMQAVASTDPTGLGLYRQNGDGSWQWLAAANPQGVAEGIGNRPGVYAILRDRLAPRISLSPITVPDGVFRTDRPEFKGSIAEYGSGLKIDSIAAEIDGRLEPLNGLASDGRFVFKPAFPLTGGEHSLVLVAVDMAGNRMTLPAIRFQVQVPLSIGEMATFPNPARGTRAVLRIAANRGDLRDQLIAVSIYDTAGHKVRWLEGVRPVQEKAPGANRYLYDVAWDLRDEDGRTVANGIYFARLEIRDPDTGKSVKKTHKIAVLR